MAANVLIPQAAPIKKTSGDNTSTMFLPAIGAVVGGIYGGGPGGAAAGMSLGSAANQAFGIKGKTTEYIDQPSSQGVGSSESAASRRMAKIEADPYTQIAQANMALQSAPKDVRDQYKKPLEEAMIIAQRSRQAGGVA